MTKQIAIVILNWNGQKLLEQFLPTVIQNSALPIAEVIVADNASSDHSIEWLKTTHPEVRLIALDQNYGFAEGYNQALMQLSHNYVVLLNSDVEPAPGWLEPLWNHMETHPQTAAAAPKIKDYKNPCYFEHAGAAGGFIDWFGFPFCRGRILNVVEKDYGQYDRETAIFWGSGAALMVRRALYIKMGGLDADFFAHMEEIDLCWRLKNRGYDIVYVPSATVYHVGGATLTQHNPHKTYLNFRNNLWMIYKNLYHPIWPLILFTRLLLDGAAALHFAAVGEWSNLSAVFRAHMHFYLRLPEFRKKREALRPLAHTTNHPEAYAGSIVWDFYIRKLKKYSQIRH